MVLLLRLKFCLLLGDRQLHSFDCLFLLTEGLLGLFYDNLHLLLLLEDVADLLLDLALHLLLVLLILCFNFRQLLRRFVVELIDPFEVQLGLVERFTN